MNDIVIKIILFLVMSIIVEIYLLVKQYIKTEKQISTSLKELDEQFEKSLERNNIDITSKALLSFKKKCYTIKLKSKILPLVLILVLHIVLAIVSVSIENAVLTEKRKIETSADVKTEEMQKEEQNKLEKIKIVKEYADKGINLIEFYGILSRLVFNIMLILSITFLGINDRILENSNDKLNTRIKEIIAELEYRLYELSKNNNQQLIIKLPDDDSVLKVEKILSSEQKLQINSYVWNRIIKK